MALMLRVINKEGIILGALEARVGLHTNAGTITRVSEKSIWTKTRDGYERLHRAYDGHMPGLPLYKLKKADRLMAGLG